MTIFERIGLFISKKNAFEKNVNDYLLEDWPHIWSTKIYELSKSCIKGCVVSGVIYAILCEKLSPKWLLVAPIVIQAWYLITWIAEVYSVKMPENLVEFRSKPNIISVLLAIVLIMFGPSLVLYFYWNQFTDYFYSVVVSSSSSDVQKELEESPTLQKAYRESLDPSHFYKLIIGAGLMLMIGSKLNAIAKIETVGVSLVCSVLLTIVIVGVSLPFGENSWGGFAAGCAIIIAMICPITYLAIASSKSGRRSLRRSGLVLTVAYVPPAFVFSSLLAHGPLPIYVGMGALFAILWVEIACALLGPFFMIPVQE
jgi:hypothetical protein